MQNITEMEITEMEICFFLANEDDDFKPEKFEIPDEELQFEFPGEECILSGLRRPNDNTVRHMRTARAESRHMMKMKTVGGYTSINRSENGRYIIHDHDEWKETIVATKKKPKSDCSNCYKKVDHRKIRYEGKTDCRNYEA